MCTLDITYGLYPKVLITPLPFDICNKKIDFPFPSSSPSSTTFLNSLNRCSLEDILEDQQAKIDRLAQLKIPLEKEALRRIYEWIKENKGRIFDIPEFTYPVLFKGSVRYTPKMENENKRIIKTKIELEVHSKTCIMLLFPNNPETKIIKGSFKSVTKAYHLIKPKIKAYAETDINGSYLASYARKNEEQFLKQFHLHKGIVKVNALFYYSHKQIIIMKLYSSDLYMLTCSLLKKEVSISNQEKLTISLQLAEILVHIHRHGVVHRDIKPENILIKSGQYVLTDWGFACLQNNREELEKQLGTPDYFSPELWENKLNTFDFSLDIWAMGCTLWELWKESNCPWYGAKDFKIESQKLVLNKMYSYHHTPLSNNHSSIQDKIERLLKNMLNPTPTKRYIAQQVFDYLKDLQPLLNQAQTIAPSP